MEGDNRGNFESIEGSDSKAAHSHARVDIIRPLSFVLAEKKQFGRWQSWARAPKTKYYYTLQYYDGLIQIRI